MKRTGRGGCGRWPAGSLSGVRTGRWAGVPATERRLAPAAAAVSGYGAVVHAVQLVLGGADPYPSVPGWMAGHFVPLTLLHPLALPRQSIG